MDPELTSCIKEEVPISDPCVLSKLDRLKMSIIKQEIPLAESGGQYPNMSLWNLDGPTGRENIEAVTDQVDVLLPEDMTKLTSVTRHLLDVTEHSLKNFSQTDLPSANDIKVKSCHSNNTSLQESTTCNETTTHAIKKEQPKGTVSCNQTSNNVDLNLAVQHDDNMEGINVTEVRSRVSETKFALVTDDIKTQIPCQHIMSTSHIPSLNEQTTITFIKTELPMVEQPCNRTSSSLDCFLNGRCEIENAVKSGAGDRYPDVRTKPVISKNQLAKPSQIPIPGNPFVSFDAIKTNPRHDDPSVQTPVLTDQPLVPDFKQETISVDVCTQRFGTEELNADCSIRHSSSEHKFVVTDEVTVRIPVDGAKSLPISNVSMIEPDEIKKQTYGKDYQPTLNAVSAVTLTSRYPKRLPTIKEEQVFMETNFVREESSGGIPLRKQGVVTPVLPTPQSRTRSPVIKEASTRIEDLVALQPDGTECEREVSSPLLEPVVCANIGDLHGWEDMLNDNQRTRFKDDCLLTDGQTLEGDYESRRRPTQGPLCRKDEPLKLSIPVDSALNTIQRTFLDKSDPHETTENAESEAPDNQSIGRCKHDTILKENCPPKTIGFPKVVTSTKDLTVVQACLEDIVSSVEKELEIVMAPNNRSENSMMNLNVVVAESSPSTNVESLPSSIFLDLESTSGCMKTSMNTVQTSYWGKPDKHLGRTTHDEGSEATNNTLDGMDNARACLDGKRSEDNVENHGENHVTSVDSNVRSMRNDSTKSHGTNERETVETVGRPLKKRKRRNTKPETFKGKLVSVSKSENLNPKETSVSKKKQKLKARVFASHGNLPNCVKKQRKKNIGSKVKSHKLLERLDAIELNVPPNQQRHGDLVNPQTAAFPGNYRLKSYIEGVGCSKMALKRSKGNSGKTVVTPSVPRNAIAIDSYSCVNEQGMGKKRAMDNEREDLRKRWEDTVATPLPFVRTSSIPVDGFSSNEQVMSTTGAVKEVQGRTLEKDLHRLEQRKCSQDSTMATPLPVATTAVSLDHRFRSNMQEQAKKRALEKGQPSRKRKKHCSEKKMEPMLASTTAVCTNECNKQARSEKRCVENKQTRAVEKKQHIVRQRQSNSEKAMKAPISVLTAALSPDDIRLSILQQRRQRRKETLRREQIKGKRIQQTSSKTMEKYPVVTTAVSPVDDLRSNKVVSRTKRALGKGKPSGKRRNPSSENEMDTPLRDTTHAVTLNDDRVRTDTQESVKKRKPSAKRRKQKPNTTMETLPVSANSDYPDDNRFENNKQKKSLKTVLQEAQLNGKRRNMSSVKVVETFSPVAGLSDLQTNSIIDEHDSNDEGTVLFFGEEENEHKSGEDNTDEGNHKISATSAVGSCLEDDKGAKQDSSSLDQDDTERHVMEKEVQSSTSKVNEGLKSARVTLVDLMRCARDPSIVVNYKLDQTVWVCPICDKLFATFACCNRHEYRHTGKRPFKCQFCDKAFNTNEIRRCHERLHTNERHFLCECGRAFNKKYHLQRHKKVHERKFFECDLCDKKFFHLSALNTHISVHHNNEKKVKCPQCDFRVKYKCQLKIHMAVHTEEKAFSCDQCDFKTKTARILKLHMMIHSDVRSYQCGECGMCFRHIQVLKNHYRTHTGEKPFKCQHCNRGFSQSGNRSNHEKICPLQ